MNVNLVAVNVKIQARRARLLTSRDYAELCERADANIPAYANDFAQIASYLPKPARDFAAKFNARGFDGVKGADALCKSSRESLRRVFSAEGDLRNILLIYRLKRFHDIHGDAVFSFLSPESHRISADEISRLAHARDIDAFIQEVSRGAYGGVFGDFSRAEQKLSQEIRRAFQKEFPRQNLAVVCGYLYERGLQEKNLRSIKIGMKNGLSPTEIFELLHI